MSARGEARLLGQMGEYWVRERLERRGADILAANWHCRYGEIDLIAAGAQVICFIEVKTRRSAAFARAGAAVDYRKQRKLLLSAQCYLLEHPEERRQPRFDVAEVYAPEGVRTRAPRIFYYPNAFDGGELDDDHSSF